MTNMDVLIDPPPSIDRVSVSSALPVGASSRERAVYLPRTETSRSYVVDDETTASAYITYVHIEYTARTLFVYYKFKYVEYLEQIIKSTSALAVNRAIDETERAPGMLKSINRLIIYKRRRIKSVPKFPPIKLLKPCF